MLSMPTPTENLHEFFRFFWRDAEGWVYTPVAHGHGRDITWRPLMFRYPGQLDAVVKHLLQNNAQPDANCYFSPVLFSRASPVKEAVLGSFTLWCDYDGSAPETWPAEPVEGKVWVPPPALRIASSVPGKEHVYWALDRFVTDVQWIDDKNRAIAYATGADTSGWDANQVLRPIHTMNRKYDPPQPVHVLSWDVDA